MGSRCEWKSPTDKINDIKKLSNLSNKEKIKNIGISKIPNRGKGGCKGALNRDPKLKKVPLAKFSAHSIFLYNLCFR
jgi:hypothetical protein